MKTVQSFGIVLIALFLIAAPLSAAKSDVLKIAKWEDINTFDPGWLTSNDRELTIMNCLYNGLVKYKEGSWDVVPDLAKSWTVSEEGKEITFQLRQGVQFHKGYGELTAGDVKFSFERIIHPESTSTEKGNWAQLDHVEVIDRYTVKIVLKDHMAQLFTSTLPSNSGMIVSKKAVTEKGDAYSLDPIGTGPYLLKEWKPKKHVKMEVFEEYWGEKPQIKKLMFIPIVEDSTCEMALRTGEVDIGRVSLLNAEAFQKNPNLNVLIKPALKHWWIGFTVNKPPFDNIKLRKACRYAINVDNILQAAFFGLAPRANTILPPGLLGHWNDAPEYKVDLEKAKRLLKEGGKPDGFDATLYIWPDEQVRITAEVIKADLARVGVDVDILTKEVGAFNEATTSGEPNMYISYYNTTIDPSYAFSWFVSGEKWNLSKWSNKKFDQLIAQGMIETDKDKRALIYKKAQKQMDKDSFAVWLTHGVRIKAAQSNIDLGKVYPDGRLAPWQFKFQED